MQTTPTKPTWDGRVQKQKRKGWRGVNQTLFNEQVVSTDTTHTLSTATKPRMLSQLIAVVGKHRHDSFGRVSVRYVHAPA